MKIAIFGGSFDPPHIAHKELLLHVQKAFHFDRIVVVPSHFPPGKSAEAPYQDRLRWVKQIFTESVFEVSTFEESASQTLFAKDIFYHLSAKIPEATFFWILGEDQWSQLTYWKDIDSYGGLLEWIVLSRTALVSRLAGLGSRRLLKSSCGYRYASIQEMAEISSTRIRNCIQQKSLISSELNWIPENIRDDVIRTYQRKEDGN